MSKNNKITLSVITAFAVFGMILLSFPFKVYGTYSAEITGIPSDIIKANVEYLDENWNSSSTKASVSVKSGNASVTNMSDTGYYKVTFFTADKEVGKAEFFLGDSGKLYSYEYELKENEYKPVYTNVNKIAYESYGYGRILDISGNNKVTVADIPDTVVSADVSVSLDNGDYGYVSNKITLKNESYDFSFGMYGYYCITFFDENINAIGTAEFTLDKSNGVMVSDFVYNSSTGEWEEKLTKTDIVYFTSYDENGDLGSAEDEVALYSIMVQNVPSSVATVEVQYLDSAMNQSECYSEVFINANGQATMDSLNEGYYTLNYYDSSNNCIGYTTFYLDENGSVYSYDKLTKIDDLKYTAFEQQNTYSYGKMSVRVYGVPEEVDNVETYYHYGDESDETIMFEPELSSLTTEPLILSNLGMEGKYSLNFFINGDSVGNAEFYLKSDGSIYEFDYQYNSKTGEWEETLIETSEIYFIDNIDIEGADDYEYGKIKFSITNVPSNVKYSEITYFENDDTFTAGSMIFPDVNIDGKGKVTVENLGIEGYYEIDLIANDAVTKVGYVFIYIDSNGNTYSIEQQINTDTFQVEVEMTKTVQIPLKEYLTGTVPYISGKNNVKIYDVPKTVDKMLLTVVLPDGSYSTYENKIMVNSDGVVTIEKLGMEGDYTVSFFTGNDYIGSASFYLDVNGKAYKADYSYDDSNNISISLSNLSKVVFERNKDAVLYEVGDIDFSGNINVADLVLLQKYILAVQPFSASQWYNADINEDGSVDVFNLCLLRGILVKSLVSN